MTPNRRNWLKSAGAAGFGSLLCQRVTRARQAQSSNASLDNARFKQCVILWMAGGPSHVDTFIPKSANAVETSVAGMQFGEAMRAMTDRAGDLCVLRSVGSSEGEHERATSLLHTGFSPTPAFPRPSLGSMVSESRTDDGFPNYVTLGERGFGPAFLGARNGPFVINDPRQAKQQIERLQRRKDEMDLLHKVNDLFSKQSVAASSKAVERRNASVESVRRLLKTDFGAALDVEQASERQRERYGENDFSNRVLAASRLLKLGVPVVEVQLGGWDSHVNNDRAVQRLCQQLVPPWIALMDDLKRTGKWDETLIVWLGEFGRTPTLNGNAGRDHFPEIIPVVLAGGNLGGNLIGEVNEHSDKRTGERHTVADLMATLLTLLGLNVEREYTTDFGSPTSMTDEGTPIQAIDNLLS